ELAFLTMKRHFEEGRVSKKDVMHLLFYLKDAEIWLCRASTLSQRLPKEESAELLDDAFEAYSGSNMPLIEEERVRSMLSRVPGDRVLKELLSERHGAALYSLWSRWTAMVAGYGTQVFVNDASEQLLKAEMELSDRSDDRLAALTSYCDRMAELEKMVKDRYEANRVAVEDMSLATWYRADAQLRVERARGAQENDQRVADLLRTRVSAAETEVAARMKAFGEGRGTLEFLLAARRRLLTSREELSKGKSDR